MKNYLLTPVILFLGLVFIFSSCANVEQNPGEEPLGEIEEVTAPPPFTDCTTACVKKDGSYEISEACATCMYGNFKVNGSQLLPNDSGDIRGFQIDQEEFTQVLNEAKKSGDAFVYTMLGIKKTIDSATKKETLSSELIFQIKITDGAGEVVTEKFFDFTKPCPDLCP